MIGMNGITVTACLAVSLDGKISPPTDGPYVRMGTKRDIEHLQRLRDDADALVFGAATFRAYTKPRFGLKNSSRPLIHCILTKTLDLPSDAPLFTHSDPQIPVMIFSSAQAPEALRAQYPPHLEWHTIDCDGAAHSVLKALEAKGAKKIQVEGGGNILPLFLNEKLLQSIHLTLCPLFVGQAPLNSALSIPGLISQPLNQVIRTKLLASKVLGDELYLHYQCLYDEHV
ncbi:MAG: dihydrofolate reductase family protein [Vampirovibrionales bacterium]|nr:dihydrofolate reductase family protein [Vampirovibrionales bacterium]